MDRWVGKVAVVTGASSGIGLAIATDLVGEGLKVAALARRADRLKELEAQLAGKKGQIKGLKCDVTKEEDVLKAFKWITDNWGGIHVLVNNAGVLRHGQIQDMSTNDFRTMLETNVLALNTCTREALKIMKNSGIDDGHIININSIVGHNILPMVGIGQYTTSKHAVTTITEYIRHELGVMKSRIRVTSLSPGLVESEMSARYLEEGKNLKEYNILPASAISQAVVYILSTPPNVNVTELTILPVGEVVVGNFGT